MANEGGFFGGLGYLGHKAFGGIVGSLEGIWDYTAGGIAEIFGAHKFAEEQLKNDWINYNAADEWFKPSGGWKTAGDVASGIGNSLPSLAASIAVAAATGGASAAVQLAAGAGTSFGVSFLSAGGNATKEAYQESGKLSGEEWGYGSLSGLTEGAVESAGTVLGLGQGAVLKALGKSAAKSAARTGLGKVLVDGFTGEAAEEFVSTAISPYLKRATYDKDAKNATAEELAYSAVVGGLSGMLMGGGGSAARTAMDYISGGANAKSEEKREQIIKAATAIKNFESTAKTGNEVFEEISNAVDKLQAGLAKNGRYTVSEVKQLGYLNERIGTALLQPQFMQAAYTVLENPEVTVESINRFYNSDKLTVDELTKGVDQSKIGSKAWQKSVAKALKSNTTLRELVAIQTLGAIELDARQYADAIFDGTPISTVATQDNLNRFVSSKDDATVSAVSSTLGIDLRTATADELAAAIKTARDNGSIDQYREAVESVEEAKSVDTTKAKNLPTTVYARNDGARVYAVGDNRYAIIKKGNNYRLYDYSSGNISIPMSLTEINSVVRAVKNQLESLKSDNRSNIINKKETENRSNESERVRIRDGGERSGGQDTEGQVSRMEGGAGQAESRREASRNRNVEAARQADEGRGVKYVAVEDETDSMKKARKLAEERGLKVRFFTGENLTVKDENGKTVSARAYIKGNRVLVRADHPVYTEDQLMRHELGHDKIAKGEVDINKVRRRLKKTVGKENINKVAELYAEAYAGTGMTSKEIWEECICDSLGDMNIFAREDAKALLDKILPEVKKAVGESKEPSKTRGPPEGKAKYSYAGVEAESADKLKLSTAEEMLKSGADPETVRKETGWFRGYDGKWRFEIDDSKATFVENPKFENRNDGDGGYFKTAKLGEIFNHNELYAAYPELKDYTIIIQQTESGTEGSTFAKDKQIVLSDKLFERLTKEYNDYLWGGRQKEIEEIENSPEYKAYNRFYEDENLLSELPAEKWLEEEQKAQKAFFDSEIGKRYYQLKWGKVDIKKYEPGWSDRAKPVLLHEIQHAVQNIEEFAKGSNIGYWAHRMQNGYDSKGRTPGDLYNDTAGEIEARDVSKRAELTAEQRKSTRPDIDRTDVVFAESSTVSYFAKGEKYEETDSVKTQLRNHLKEINKMDPVINVNYHVINKEKAKQDTKAFYKSKGSKVDRLNFGIIEMSENEVEGSSNYANTPAEFAAWRTIPSVLKRGRLISGHSNHKSEGFPTYTFAAPVVINGIRGNVAVVVKKTGKYRYKMHRILMPDGSVFVYKEAKENAEPTGSDILLNNKEKGPDISSASTNSISQKSDLSTENLKKDSVGKASRELDTEVKAPVDGMAAKAKAEYVNDKVFNKSEALAAIRSISGAEKLKAKEREALADKLWIGLNEKVAEKNREKQLAELSDELYSDMSNLLNSEDATEVIKLKIRISDAVKDLYKNGGHESKKAKAEAKEANVDNVISMHDEYNKATLALNRTAQSIRNKLNGSTFDNATVYQGESIKGLLSEVSAFEYRQTFSENEVREKIGNLLTWYNKDNPMLCYEDEQNRGVYVESIHETLEALATGKKKLTAEELSALDGVLRHFVHLAENYRKAWMDGKWVEAAPLAKKYAENVTRSAADVTNVLKIYRNGYVAAAGTPETVMLAADGYVDGFFSKMHEELNNAEVEADIQIMEIEREVDDFLEANKKYSKKLSNKTVKIFGEKFSKLELMEYYMTLKRKQAHEALAYNGIILKSKEDGKGEDLVIGGFAQGQKDLTEEQLETLAAARRAEIEKEFNEKDKKFVKLLEKGYEATRDIKREADLKRLGISNVIEGYYYPIKRSYAKTKTVDVGAEAGFVDRFAYASFNKHAKEGAQQPIAIGSAYDTFTRHVKGIVYYSKVSPVVDTYNKMWKLNLSENNNTPRSLETLNSQSKATWRDKKNNIVGNKYFRDEVYNIMNGSYARNALGSETIGGIRGKGAVAALAANLKVMITQISSWFAASSKLSYGSLVRGLSVSARDVDKYCKLAELRNRDKTAVKASGVIDTIGGVGEFLTKHISFMDRRVVCRLFGACQAEVAKNGGAKIGTEENKTAAGKLLESVILETQQNSFVTTKNNMARNGGELLKSLMMFRSDAVQTQGKVLSEVGRAWAIRKRLKNGNLSDAERATLKAELKKCNRNAGKAVFALALSSVWVVGASHIMNALFNKEKDKDEELWVSALWDLGGNMLGGLPGFADVYEYMVDGFDIESMEMGIINDMLQAVKAAFDYTGKVTSGTAEQRDTNALIKNTLFTLGQASGVPARNLYNLVYGITRRFNESAAYKIDDIFRKQNYNADFKDAAEGGKNELAKDILEMSFEANVGEGISDEALEELTRLASLGLKVAPSAISKSITIDGKEYELTEEEKETVQDIYAEAITELNKLVKSKSYAKLEDAEKEKEIKNLFTRYRKMGYDEVKEKSYGVTKKSSSPYAGLFSSKTSSGTSSGSSSRSYSALFSKNKKTSGAKSDKKLSYGALLGVK